MTNLIHNRRPYKSLTARTAVIVAGMLSVTAAHAGTATQPSNRPTNLQLGASVVYSDKGYRNYDGNTNVYPAIFYENHRFYVRGNQLGVNLIQDRQQNLALNAQYAGDSYDASEASGAFKGLDDRDASVMVGASYQRNIQYVAVRGQVVTDVSGNSDGTTARLSVGTRLPRNDWTLYPSAGLQWQDKNYNDYYYGITAAEAARTGIAQYSPSSSVHPFISVAANYQLNPKVMLFVNPSIAYNVDDIHDSPKIDSRLAWGTTLGVTYKLR